MSENVYYDPEKFGLTVFGEVENAGGYEFDTFVVWQNAKGDFLWAYDAGCSCPTPFDDESLATLPVGSARDAHTDLVAWIGQENYEWSTRKASAAGLLEKLAALS